MPITDFDAPDVIPQTGARDSLERIPDGNYTMCCGIGRIEKTKEKQLDLVVIPVRINGGQFDGTVADWTRVLADKDAAGRCMADLKSIGFDTENWNKGGRRFSIELPKALAACQGIMFEGKKSTNPGKGQNSGKTYHNLSVVKLVTGPGKTAGPTVASGDSPW